MSRPQSPGAPVFSLETDDRTDEERARARDGTAKDRVASALGMGGSDPPRAPMDTGGQYQEDIERAKPAIKFNLNFFDKGDRSVSRFDIETLFEAAGSGDVMKLDGLHQYLKKNMKKLTNSEYQSYGKNALQKALLNLRDGENKVVEFLLEISERMGDIKDFVNAAFTDSYYKGQTALHIAIERRSQYYVELLVKKGADVHAKACGKFFQPQDGPSFYFGELPLSLAACTNQQSAVDFLLENEHGRRADVRETDSRGNTVLHALVAVADNSDENTAFVTAMYDHVLTSAAARLHPEWRLEDMENAQGLTPLKLAAKTGKIGIFGHILRREFKDTDTKHLSRKFTEWAYGPVHSSLYDLASLDSYKDSNSVLEILVYGSDIPNRHQMLQLEPLSRLLEEKWSRFAGRIFFLNFLVYVLYLVVFTMVAYNKKDKPPFSIQHTTDGYLYLSGQLLMTLASCYFFIRGIVDMRRKRPKLQTLLIDGYSEILFFVQSLLFLACAVLYCCGRQEYLGFLVLCLALSWINLLYFSRGNRHMGIYSVMIQKMILSDILRFLFVYLVFLFGFSAAVVTLLIDPAGTTTNGSTTATPPDAAATNGSSGGRSLFGGAAPPPPEENGGCLKPSYRNISYTTLELFKFTIGMGDLEFTERYEYKEVFYVLLISYIILTYILLLNMLIALMSRTVEQITAESMSIWKLQRAITILDLEKGLPRCLRDKFRSGVEKDLSTTAGGDRDRRRCFRVEEVNWNRWNINLGIINEEPGDRERAVPSPTAHSPADGIRGRSWRGVFREASRYTRQRHHGRQTQQQTQQQTTEMSPLSSSPV